MKITNLKARQILDSRGVPTIECSLVLDNGVVVTSSVPAGKSKGSYEVYEMRDGDPNHFGGQGVLKAVGIINNVIAPMLIGSDPDVIGMDQVLCSADGRHDKSKLGGNSILAVSIAVARAQAMVEGVHLFTLINQLWSLPKPTIPTCQFNLINGGMHAANGLSVQEFLIIPRVPDFSLALECADTIYQTLKELLQRQGLAISIGDEGGFAPRFNTAGRVPEFDALMLLQQAASEAGFSQGHVGLGLDVAATHLYDRETETYRLHDASLSATELISWYRTVVESYGLLSLEDPLGEDDWDGWKLATGVLGKHIQLVGDDLFATNIERIDKGAALGIANAVLIKPNQIGTVTETVLAIKRCQEVGYKTIVSHRSGETNDTFIVDLAVGTSADQLKAGAPVRGERVAKYNRLLDIAQILG